MNSSTWRDPAYLLDMLVAARKARDLMSTLDWSQFEQSELHQLAVVRLLTIIGEAARSISDATKDANPTIEWRSISAMRNRLIHEYFRVNLQIVWDVVQNDLPDLIQAVEPLVPPDE